MKFKFLAILPAAGMLAIALSAQAESTPFSFSGSGVSGSGTLTYTAPVGGVASITGITGTFSDSHTTFNGNAVASIDGATITGLVGIDPVDPLPAGVTATDFSRYDVVNGIPAPPASEPSNALSYDNTLYFGGSPVVCSDYPFSGGFLDVYGLLFNVSTAGGDNYVVGLWSNGLNTHIPGASVTYGVAVADPTNTYDYVGDVSAAASAVPEPATWALMGLGLLAVMPFVRRRKSAVR